MDSAHDTIHIDLDGAWPKDTLPECAYLDCQGWGPRLRYSTTRSLMHDFEAFIAPERKRFTLFGSGDFHHLSAVWLRRISEPFTLISFDNHPDWDTRPPHWCCGTWINRALESPLLRRASVWGCGNFEFEWPSRLFVNRQEIKSGRLMARPWRERLKPATRKLWPVLDQATWRQEMINFASALVGTAVYITVDFDCLNAEESITNWESGMFSAKDVAWAIGEVAQRARIVGGDVCGAYSPQRYARFRQRIEGFLDHPKPAPVDRAEAERRNEKSLRVIWAALTVQG